MNKRLLISVFLCFFILTLGGVAQKKGEKVRTYEFLLRADVWGGAWEKEIDEDDWENRTEEYTETYHLGHVPPSPKTEVIFYDYVGSFNFDWANFEIRKVQLYAEIVFSSDNIPDYEILIGSMYCQESETNNTNNEPLLGERQPFSDRIPMWRNRLDYWWVGYKGTENTVPEEEAIPIINKFMDNGFDVGYRIWFRAKGVRRVGLGYFGLEVTRLSKN